MTRVLIALALLLLAAPAEAQTVSGDPCVVPRKLTRTRPDPDGPPVRVEIGIFLIDLIAVNEVE